MKSLATSAAFSAAILSCLMAGASDSAEAPGASAAADADSAATAPAAAAPAPADPAVPAAPEPFTQDIDAALGFAAASGLPVLLDFSGSDWCYWCKLMDSRVFSRSEWKTWAPSNVVTALVDFPRDESLVPEKWRSRNEALARKYGIRGFPTFVVLGADGSEIGRLGASATATPESFAAEFEAIVANQTGETSSANLTEEEAEELSTLSSRIEELEKKLDDIAKTTSAKTDEWREKIIAAKDSSAESLAAMRRAATREIAAVMSSAQSEMAEARRQMDEAAARVKALRDKAAGR